MKQTVTTASQICRAVRTRLVRKPSTPRPKTSAAISAATRMPVPVASGWNTHTAA